MFIVLFIYLVVAFGTAKYVFEDSDDGNNRNRLLIAIVWGLFWFITIPGSLVAEFFDWIQNG